MQRIRSVAVALILSLSFAAVALAQPAASSRPRITRTIRGSITGRLSEPAAILATDFVDPSHGYVSVAPALNESGRKGTNEGKLLVTSTGGQTWTIVSRTRFQALGFVSDTHGFGLTGHGRLLVTASGGRQWRQVHAFHDLRNAFNDSLSFPDSVHGWIASSGAIYRTVNGGATWSTLSFHCSGAVFGGGITGISFVNDHYGFLLCNSGNGPSRTSLYRTENGGLHWVRVSTVDAMSHVGGTLDFRSPTLGFSTVGFGSLVRTVDGGKIFQSVPGSPSENVQGFSWVNAHTGYAFLPAALVKTTDGGRHWWQVYPGVQPVGPISFSSLRDGIGAATSWDQSAILATRDGGFSWRQLTSVPNTIIDSFVHQPGGALWAVATVADPHTGAEHAAVLRASLGGMRWQVVRSLPGSATLSFVTARVAYLLNSFPENLGRYGNRLYRSRDGGRVWVSVAVQQDVGDVQFTSPSTGWGFALGKGFLPPVHKPGLKKIPRRHTTVLVKTDDAGRSWQQISFGLVGFLPSDLAFRGQQDGWVSGSQCRAPGKCSSLLLRTANGGSKWESIRLGHFFIDNSPIGGFDAVSRLLAFTNTGVAIYRTRDGGVHWQIVK